MASTDIVRNTIAEVQERGYSVLRRHLPAPMVDACRRAFWPRLLTYLHGGTASNRGPARHFVPMPFESPCFAREFFFDADVLGIVRGLMDEGVVADQWGCDVPLRGSQYQDVHADYQRPLFPELPDLVLPPYAIVVSFGLVRIALEHGPIEIAPGTHRLTRPQACAAVQTGNMRLEPVTLEIGDVLVRHPWTLHRGTPNMTAMPRALASIRYVRRWYSDDSRDVERIPRATLNALSAEQRRLMRFPAADA